MEDRFAIRCCRARCTPESRKIRGELAYRLALGSREMVRLTGLAPPVLFLELTFGLQAGFPCLLKRSRYEAVLRF
jgi:hypothetical protein